MRRRLAFHRDLGLQLLAFYLLLIVPFFITLWVFDGLIGVRIRQDVQASDLALAQSISQETNIAIAKALDMVRGLASYPGVIEGNPAAMRQVFSVIFNTTPEVNLVYRLDANGIMAYHYPEGPSSTVGVDFSFRDYFQRALQTHDPLVSQGRISPTTNQAVATAVMPLWSEDGKFLGLVGANIRLESLSQALSAILSEHQSEEGLQVVILDSAGQIIAHPRQELLLHPAGDILPQALLASINSAVHSQIYEDLNGEERLYTSTSVSGIRWLVVVSRPISAAFGTQIILRRIVIVAVATFILIGLFFWRMLSVRVIRPIERLARISKAIGLNQPISAEEQRHLIFETKRSDQIGNLIQSIIRMRDSIQEHIQEQATLLETSTAVVSSLDTETVLNRILEQMGRLLQIKMYAVIALDETNGRFRIRASRGLSKQFTEQLSIPPSEPDSVTMRALRAREPVQVSDTETDPSYNIRKHRARLEGFRAILAVPLNTKLAPPTALLVFRPTPHEFTHNEIQLLTSFANHAAMAIENAVLFERSDMQLQEQTQRLEALVQSLHDGLILTDLHGRVIYANKRVGELAELDAKTLSGMHADHILARIIDKASPPSQDLLQAGRKNKIEITRTLPNETVHLRLEVFSVNDEEGVPIGHGIFFHDITADWELDRVRSSLISTVSHELRTPLAAIKGYVSTMLADDVEWDRASQREFLTIISNESDRLTSLVNNLLDLSRIEAGSLKLSMEKCDTETVIRNAAMGARLSPHNIFEVFVAPKAATLYADRLRLESILRNLIENSVKYAGENAAIKVEVERKAGEIVFRISDNGPGIPPEERERVFERFYRVDERLTRPVSGAGLGLAICQGLVRAHGGKIWVEPQAEGACIVFTIPVKARVAVSASGRKRNNEHQRSRRGRRKVSA